MPLRSPAPRPAYRLIPSQFPPIGVFDTVATAADLRAVMELVGWTNDRLVAHRIARLPEADWVYGRANASIIMAAFLHVAPGGMRFNGSELGAWYAAASLTTAIAEVGHHLRREAVARAVPAMERVYRCFVSTLVGDYTDLTGTNMPEDLRQPASYAASQQFGEAMRQQGEDGLIYSSFRHEGGINVVAYRPRKIEAVTQAEHLRIAVKTDDPRIRAERLAV